MSQNFQYIVIGAIVGWAGIFLIRRIYTAFKIPKDGCSGNCGCVAGELKKEKK